MKIVVTGLNGTLAPKVAREATTRGHQVIGWNRNSHPPDELENNQDWLEQQSPDAVLHLAMGGEAWAAWLAMYAAQNNLPFVFTSTAMVFDHLPDGPHHHTHPRTAQDDYGQYKIRCEDQIQASNPAACIARIGYQMDWDAQGNNMIAHLMQQATQGNISASSAWIPACSFMTDTAKALIDLLEQPQAGVFHLDSNAQTAYSYDQIVRAIKQHLNTDWKIEINQNYQHDQRLIGYPMLPPLHSQLEELRSS